MSTGSKTERAHKKYREGQHEEALQLYSEALSVAKLNSHRIALHSNKAACHLKLQNFKKVFSLEIEAALLGACPFKELSEECSAVLELDCKHSGALMLRAQTLVAMKDYHSALFDVNRLIELNPSSDVYRNLQARLKTQLSLAPIPEVEEEIPASEMEETESTDPETHKYPTLHPSHSPSQGTSSLLPKGWDAIPKPKGHSGLDYSRWDKVENDSSDDEEDEDSEPQYRFRLRTVGVRPVT